MTLTKGWLSLSDGARLGPDGFAGASYWTLSGSRQVHLCLSIGVFPTVLGETPREREQLFLAYLPRLPVEKMQQVPVCIGDVLTGDLRHVQGPAFALLYLGSATKMVGDVDGRIASHVLSYYWTGREQFIVDRMWQLWSTQCSGEDREGGRPRHYWHFGFEGLELGQYGAGMNTLTPAGGQLCK